MFLTIDNLASRYHCLPSEVMQRANSFDLEVLNISVLYERRRQDIADGRGPAVPVPSQTELQAMVNRVREQGTR